MTIPELPRHCGSWVVVSRATGAAVFETFERRTAEAVNAAAYDVVTAAEWLARINRAGAALYCVRDVPPPEVVERQGAGWLVATFEPEA
jgi:hypothetical protein